MNETFKKDYEKALNSFIQQYQRDHGTICDCDIAMLRCGFLAGTDFGLDKAAKALTAHDPTLHSTIPPITVKSVKVKPENAINIH